MKTHATRMVNLKILNLCSVSFKLFRIANGLSLIRCLPNLQILLVKLVRTVFRNLVNKIETLNAALDECLHIIC